MSSVDAVPQHIAIVMDGNGRWAKQRYLPRTAGHREGVKTTRRIIEACGKAGVKILTLFAFSSENWKRPQSEVSALMSLFIAALENEIQKLNENDVKLCFIGDRTQFNTELQDKISSAEQITANNKSFTLNIAANYGGRWDIVQAARKLCCAIADNKVSANEVDESVFESYLSTYPHVDPDLFIRTAGEQRISNFLMWQLAYTELYFADVYWPEFDEHQLQLAIESYANRVRKFGRTQEQLDNKVDA